MSDESDYPAADDPDARVRPAIEESPGAESEGHGDVPAQSDVPAGPDAATSRRRRTSKPGGVRARFELPILILAAVAVAILLKTFVIQPFYIPSESMEKTLHGCSSCQGDRILVFKPIYHIRDPHPGDIVVFKGPPAWPGEGGTVLSSNPIVHAVQWVGQLVGVVPPSQEDLVKRVIAVGGQTVKCCDAAGNVEVSDDGVHFRSLTEPYVFDNDDPLKTFGPVLVPRGRLWVLGDHRGDSADSRFHCVAGAEYYSASDDAKCDPIASTVPVSDVIGKAVAIAWPPSRWRTLGTPSTFSAAGLPGPVSAATEPAGVLVLGGALLATRRRSSPRRSLGRRSLRRPSSPRASLGRLFRRRNEFDGPVQ